MRQAFAPVGTRLRRAAATEDGGEGVFGRARPCGKRRCGWAVPLP